MKALTGPPCGREVVGELSVRVATWAPVSEPLFGDFHMFQLVPRDGVLVLGFAKAFTVTGSDFAIVAHISKA